MLRGTMALFRGDTDVQENNVIVPGESFVQAKGENDAGRGLGVGRSLVNTLTFRGQEDHPDDHKLIAGLFLS